MEHMAHTFYAFTNAPFGRNYISDGAGTSIYLRLCFLKFYSLSGKCSFQSICSLVAKTGALAEKESHQNYSKDHCRIESSLTALTYLSHFYIQSLEILENTSQLSICDSYICWCEQAVSLLKKVLKYHGH
jgi:hypothetical protein